LMDEPLSNLDAKLRGQMRAELKKLQKDLGITTIYVTHDQVEAMTMADRIALMHKGVLQQCAPPKTVYDEPGNQFVAGFIGNPPINFIDAHLTDDGVLDMKEFSVELPEHIRAILVESMGQDVVIGVRPQEVSVHTDSKPAGGFPVEVYTTEPMGDMTILDLKSGDIILKVVVSPDHEAREGQRIHASFSLSKIHVFDSETGEILM
jgi:multiple sugar transport system ATP-binding protein